MRDRTMRPPSDKWSTRIHRIVTKSIGGMDYEPEIANFVNGTAAANLSSRLNGEEKNVAVTSRRDFVNEDFLP
jgi:hypothetical protein